MNSLMQAWKSLSASVEVGVLTPGWNLDVCLEDSAEGTRIFRSTVVFDSPFAAPPVVHLGLTGFDIDHRDSGRLNLRATDITATSFVVEITTWLDTRVYSVGFSWLTLGA